MHEEVVTARLPAPQVEQKPCPLLKVTPGSMHDVQTVSAFVTHALDWYFPAEQIVQALQEAALLVVE